MAVSADSSTLTQLVAETHSETHLPATPAVKAQAVDQVSSPAVFITLGEVALGTAAALTPTPTFDVADELAAPPKTNWVTALSRLMSSPRRQRPTRARVPSRMDFVVDSRMSREMLRL